MAVGALPAVLSAQTWNVDSARAPEKLLQFTATEGTWTSLDISPDGRWIAFDLLGHVYEMPIAGGAARPLTRGRSWNHFPRYSPDGSTLLFTSDRSGSEAIWMLDRRTDSLTMVGKAEVRTFQATWAADGRHFYATVMDMGARFSAWRFDLYGSKEQIVPGGVWSPPTHLVEHRASGKVYFGRPTYPPVDQAVFKIKTYDLTTGEIGTAIERQGGAADPAFSPDGHWLVYVHRDDQQTVLVLHDMTTERERVLAKLDRDRQESRIGTTFGAYPNLAWHPNGREVFVAWGGKIHAIEIGSGRSREIPFQAPVERQLAQTIRFPVPLAADGMARTRSHRWGLRTDRGIVFEALGDLQLLTGERRTNLTNSAALETSPAYDPATHTLYYASWTDDSLGSIWSRPLEGKAAPVKLTTVPAQYGSLTLSPDGKTLAFLRGGRDLVRGQTLVGQNDFDLVVIGPDRIEHRVTEVNWGSAANPWGVRRPPGITFAPGGDRLYFTEFVGDSMALKRIRLDGREEHTLSYFPHAQRVIVSPDLKWAAFREYYRTYVTPLGLGGKPAAISGFDHQGVSFRVDQQDGEFVEWTPDSRGLMWTRGIGFYEKSLDDVLAARGPARKTDLSFEYAVAVPSSTIALTNARVVTMDPDRRVLENATVVVRRNRIESVGTAAAVPSDARVFDLHGKTVIPGLLDAHAHYRADMSTLNVLEQNHSGLLANLAYGATTLYEVYGNHLKDFSVSDLQRAGLTGGSRLFSTGPPIFGLRWLRPRIYRPILSQADADEAVQFNKDYGATSLKDYVQFTRSARQQLYAAARRLGMNVVSESSADWQMDLTMLIDGITGIEHTIGLTPLYDDVVRLWAATDAGNTPTLIVSYNGPYGETYFHETERLWEDPKLLRFLSKDYLLQFRRPTRFFDDDIYAVEMAREIRKLAAAGVSLQVSGHGQMAGLDKHWDMELMAKGGFDPKDILSFATIKSARYLGLDRELGSIEAGKVADLVILGANPLEDIRNTRQIEMVMLNGVLYDGADGHRVHPDPAAAKLPHIGPPNP
ncbi:MAG: amidohydrolase family protein [Gemmatimonadota bacterium]